MQVETGAADHQRSYRIRPLFLDTAVRCPRRRSVPRPASLRHIHQVGAGMGALGNDGVRRGEFVSKRVIFEGIVSDPALDGGVAACCVAGNGGAFNPSANYGSTRSGTNFGSTRGGGGGGGVPGAAVRGADGGGTSSSRKKPHHRDGGSPADLALVTSGSATKDHGRDESGHGGRRPSRGQSFDGNDQTDAASPFFVAPVSVPIPAPGGSGGGSGGGGGGSDGGPAGRVYSGRATAGGSSTPAEGVSIKGGRVRGTGSGGGVGGMGGGRDTSFVFVWPGKLEATTEAGLQARVPYRLTCVRVTAFESRFRGARNALLAGTKEGLVLAFDWGCLLRDSASGGKNEGQLGWEGEVLAPSAQVR